MSVRNWYNALTKHLPERGDYLDLIRREPPPTSRQAALFASYISRAHSWYKHLPIDRKVPFVVYLNPSAGRLLARTRFGRERMFEVVDTSHHIHYTAQATSDYRRRFGIWDYSADYGISLQYSVGKEQVDTAGVGMKALGSDGRWRNIPSEMVAAGTVALSAAVHPHANVIFWEAQLRGRALPEGTPPDRRFTRAYALFRSLSSRAAEAVDLTALPPAVREALDGMVLGQDLWRLDEQIQHTIATAGGAEDLFTCALDYLELRDAAREWKRLTGLFGTGHSHEELQQLVSAERMRQLRSVRNAMDRFMKKVYQPE